MGGRWHHPIMISVMIVIIISNDRILIASIIVNVDIIIIESMKNRLYFSFLFLNFCLARTRLDSASTIGTIGIVTSWPGDSHKQTNKNICHICNYRKQYKYNSHKCKWYHETDSNHLKRYDRRKVQTIQKRLQLQTSQTFSPGLSVNVLELPWWRRDRIWTDILQSVVFCWIFLK